MSDQKICPTCGTEYPLSERFCPRDGTALRAAVSTADLLGQIVADRYHVLKKLGEGGMGTVYLAEHVKMGRKSALKVMNPGMNTDPDAIARFNREASNASRLSHPNICAIYDFGETPDGLIYLAMEFIEGESLTSLIEKAGSLPPGRAGSIIHQAADALQVAHDAGIVHRDLKPDNIMVAKTREGGDLVKVVDFGIAKASSSEAQNVTRAGLVVGTPEYMSPEQLAADKLDGRSDLYSLGLVAFNCLTGTLPFPADTAQEAMIARLTVPPRTLAEMRPDVEWPEAVQATLDKALARDVDERYQGAAQFGREFAAAISEMPATQATEGATMVIGAQKATPTPANLPATRVAKSPPKGSAAAPAAVPKSRIVPIAAGGAVVAVAAAVGWMILTKPDSPVADPGALAQGPPAAESSAANPGSATAPRDTVRMNRPVANPTPPATRTDPTGTTASPPPTPTGPSVMTRLEGWLAEVQDPNATGATVRRVLADLEGVRPSLSGRQLGEWHFVELNALIAREDPDACRAARDVKRLLTDPSRVSVADFTLRQVFCQ
ncbi:MAG: protein kinase [Gemmatimonadaceae bacterium]